MGKTREFKWLISLMSCLICLYRAVLVFLADFDIREVFGGCPEANYFGMVNTVSVSLLISLLCDKLVSTYDNDTKDYFFSKYTGTS